MKLKFGQYLAVDTWLRLRGLIFVEILKLGLVKILKFRLSTNAEIQSRSYFGKQNSTLRFVQPLEIF